MPLSETPMQTFSERVNDLDKLFSESPDFSMEVGSLRDSIRRFGSWVISERQTTDELLKEALELEERIMQLEEAEDSDTGKGLFGMYRSLVHHYLAKHLSGSNKAEIRAKIESSEAILERSMEYMTGIDHDDLEGYLSEITSEIGKYEREDEIPEVLMRILYTVFETIRHSIDQMMHQDSRWSYAQKRWDRLQDIAESNPIVSKILKADILVIKTNQNQITARNLSDNRYMRSPTSETKVGINNIKEVIITYKKHIEEIVEGYGQEGNSDFWYALSNAYSALYENRIYEIQAFLARKRNTSTQNAIELFESLNKDQETIVTIITEVIKEAHPEGDFNNPEFVAHIAEVAENLQKDLKESLQILRYRFRRMQIEDSEPFDAYIADESSDGRERRLSFDLQIENDESTLNTLIHSLKGEMDSAFRSHNYQYAIKLFKNLSRILNLRLNTMYEDMCSVEMQKLSEGERQQRFQAYYVALLEAADQYTEFEAKIRDNYNIFDKAHLLFSKSFFFDHIMRMEHRTELIEIYKYEPRLAIGMGLKGVFTFANASEDKYKCAENEAIIRDVYGYVVSDAAYDVSRRDMVPERFQHYIDAADRMNVESGLKNRGKDLVNTLQYPYPKRLRLLRQALLNADVINDRDLREQVLGQIQTLVELSQKMNDKFVELHRKQPAFVGNPNFYTTERDHVNINAGMLLEDENLATIKEFQYELYGNEKPIFVMHSEREMILRANWQEIFSSLKRVVLNMSAMDVVIPENIHKLISPVITETRSGIINGFSHTPTLTQEEIEKLQSGEAVEKTTKISSEDKIGMTNVQFYHYYYVPQFLTYEDQEAGRPHLMVYVSHEPLSSNERDFLESQKQVFRMILDSINNRIKIINDALKKLELVQVRNVLRNILTESNQRFHEFAAMKLLKKVSTLEKVENILVRMNDDEDFDDPDAKAALYEAIKDIASARRTFGEKSFDVIHSVIHKTDAHTEHHSRMVLKIIRDFKKSVDLRQYFASEEDYERFIKLLEMAALHHDIGKLVIDISVLEKKGLLSVYEREEVHKHLIASVEICKRLLQLPDEETTISFVEPVSKPTDTDRFIFELYRTGITRYRKDGEASTSIDRLGNENDDAFPREGAIHFRSYQKECDLVSPEDIVQVDILREKSYQETSESCVVDGQGTSRSEAIISALREACDMSPVNIPPHVVEPADTVVESEDMDILREMRCRYSIEDEHMSGDTFEVSLAITFANEVVLAKITPDELINSHHLPPYMFGEVLGDKYRNRSVELVTSLLAASDISEALTSTERSYRDAIPRNLFNKLVMRNPNISSHLKSEIISDYDDEYDRIKIHHLKDSLRGMLGLSEDHCFEKYPRFAFQWANQGFPILLKLFDDIVDTFEDKTDEERTAQLPPNILKFMKICDRVDEFILENYPENISAATEEILFTQLVVEVVGEITNVDGKKEFATKLREVEEIDDAIKAETDFLQSIRQEMRHINHGRFKLHDAIKKLALSDDKSEKTEKKIALLEAGLARVEEKYKKIQQDERNQLSLMRSILMPKFERNRAIREELWRKVQYFSDVVAEELVEYENKY